jgi:putative oxidoreductase
MNLVQRMEHWGDAHHPKWIDILRIALGVFLCLKGIEFATHMSLVMNLVADMPFSSFMVVILGHYIIYAHIMGGFLLAVGLLTRVAAIIQIPILLGAIIFVNYSPVWRPFSELFLALFILLLLVYFLIIGSGPWSLDRVIERESK